MHVLVIDDDVPTREALTAVLEDDGHVVSQAADGREALNLLGRMELPDVALLDMMMPIMTGWRFLEVVRQSPTLRRLRVIVMSAASEQLLTTTGAAAIVRKPLDIDHLLAVVHQVGSSPARD